MIPRVSTSAMRKITERAPPGVLAELLAAAKEGMEPYTLSDHMPEVEKVLRLVMMRVYVEGMKLGTVEMAAAAIEQGVEVEFEPFEQDPANG